MNYYKTNRYDSNNLHDVDEGEFFNDPMNNLPANSNTCPRQTSNSFQSEESPRVSTASNNTNCSAASDTNTGIPLAVCQVVYLGAAPPEPGTSGLQAVQKPLTELYRDPSTAERIQTLNGNVVPSFICSILKGGCEATLAVYSFGVKLIYSPEPESPSVNIWFPISNLFVCAAVRCVKSLPQNRRFVPLDLAEADESNESPLFAAIFRQSKARHVTECFCFVCKTKQDAMDLVLGCTTAFENFVKNKPCSTSGYASDSRKNSESIDGYDGVSKELSQDEDFQSSDDVMKNDEWQPILVRRLWLPAPAAPQMPSTYQNSRSRINNKIMAKRMNLYGRTSKKQLLEQYLQAQQMQPYNFKTPPAGGMLRWPSADGVSSSTNDGTKTKNMCHHSNTGKKMSKKASSSSLSLYGGSSYKDVETLQQILQYNDNQSNSMKISNSYIRQTEGAGIRQWSSQPSLDGSGAVSRWPGETTIRREAKSNTKKGFIERVRRMFFPHKHSSQPENIADSHHIQHHNGVIDYATIASDEADLLRVQTDCYGSNNCVVGTLTKHPLPNEKAFMRSIRNQQNNVNTVPNFKKSTGKLSQQMPDGGKRNSGVKTSSYKGHPSFFPNASNYSSSKRAANCSSQQIPSNQPKLSMPSPAYCNSSRLTGCY